MGSYLSQPVTAKETVYGASETLEYACTAMQGWRTHMEDAHLTILNIGGLLDNIALFSVFDGHGGREVARFVENWLPREAPSIADPNDLKGSMVKLYNRYVWEVLRAFQFPRMDDLLRDPQHQAELQSYRQLTVEGQEGSVGQNSRALSLLQGSIQSDLQDLREKKGQVSRDDATQVMMKMMFLRRLEQRVGNGGEVDHLSSSTLEDTNIADSAGCTAITVLITATEFVIANAGDSRAVLCRDGRAVPLSQDHKPNDEKESARIIKAGGTVEESQGGARTHYRVNGNLNLSRAIGDLEYKKNPCLMPEDQIISSTPDVLCIDRCSEDEFIVLGCDGVWDVMSNEDCVQFIRSRLYEGKPLKDICEEIADECLSPDPKATQGLGADNITCIIVDVSSK